ncbi:hypothetical protein ElyMa_002506900 [Elysia marginata]|uniref:Uncharacterized protein n=1 Tax=Elysia marginata TaxID=1093978 RepID=A0AAV4GT77_9GAST|nr:hypothetical protein ElyMa_002506900 [Elysia marginata]
MNGEGDYLSAFEECDLRSGGATWRLQRPEISGCDGVSLGSSLAMTERLRVLKPCTDFATLSVAMLRNLVWRQDMRLRPCVGVPVVAGDFSEKFSPLYPLHNFTQECSI